MKAMNAVAYLSTFVVTLTLSAQEAQRPAGGGLAERFQQFDKNGDGKLTREEAGAPRWFDAVDRDGDGALSEKEIRVLEQSRKGRSQPSAPAPSGENSDEQPVPKAKDTGAFVPDDVRISPPGRPFSDPEFNDVQHRMAYWDYGPGGQLNISVAELDPQTGLLKSATGRDFAVDESVSPCFKVYSCEPIAPETGINGVSYFSLNATRTKGANRGETGRTEKDGSIWVLGLGGDPANRLVRRVDEGTLSGIRTTRYEAESMLGTEEVFIYYERKDPKTGRGELRRCRTGISVPGKSSSNRLNPKP